MCELEGQLSPAWLINKWENRKQKYTELKAPPTGVSTEGGEPTATPLPHLSSPPSQKGPDVETGEGVIAREARLMSILEALIKK